jgi:hypothetical protein
LDRCPRVQGHDTVARKLPDAGGAGERAPQFG